ncbi:MAG: carbohydrate kinase [Caldithrix sp.]|nr:carbohydrate kinase [Caldithrix sp.]
MDKVVLAIDAGTQSVRSILFDAMGKIVGIHKVPITPYTSEQPGYAENDAEQYWQAMVESVKGLLTRNIVPVKNIQALSITTQRSTVINLDKYGNPLRPAIVWLDQRRTEDLPDIQGPWKYLFKVSGLSDTVHYLRAEAEANWIKTHQPQIWEKTAKYLFLSGYLTYKLTENFTDSVAAQVGYIPFDFKRQQWSRPYDWKWQAIPVKKRMLPELVKPGQMLGKISEQAAEQTGLPKHLPVIAAGADKACEVIGSGCLTENMACLGLGTTATINVISREYKEIIPLLPAYPSVIPDAYNLEIQIFRGFWMVSWFKEEFGSFEQQLAEEEGIPAEEILERMIKDIPPGSDGLVLQPYWSPGLRHPGPEARGSIIGFSDIHTRGHFYRAILEGIGYALKEGSERIEKGTHTPIKELYVAGGGSQSPTAMQIMADIFGLPATGPHTFEASGLGAAICAAVGSGMYENFSTAVHAMTRPGERFEPRKSTHEQYSLLYRDVYKRMYTRLKTLYRSIKNIQNG